MLIKQGENGNEAKAACTGHSAPERAFRQSGLYLWCTRVKRFQTALKVHFRAHTVPGKINDEQRWGSFY